MDYLDSIFLWKHGVLEDISGIKKGLKFFFRYACSTFYEAAIWTPVVGSW